MPIVYEVARRLTADGDDTVGVAAASGILARIEPPVRRLIEFGMVHENDVVHRHHAPRTGTSDVGRKFVAEAVEDIHSAQADGAAHGVTAPERTGKRPDTLRRHDSGIVRHLEPAAVALPRSKQGIAIIRSVFGQQPHRTPRIVSQTASIKEKPLRIEPDIHDIPLFDERFRARKDKTIYRKTAIQPPFFRNWHPSRLRRRPVSDRCRRAARIPVSHRERQRAAAPSRQLSGRKTQKYEIKIVNSHDRDPRNRARYLPACGETALSAAEERNTEKR